MKSPNSESNFPMSNFENVSPNENPVNYSHETVTGWEKKVYQSQWFLFVPLKIIKYYP